MASRDGNRPLVRSGCRHFSVVTVVERTVYAPTLSYERIPVLPIKLMGIGSVIKARMVAVGARAGWRVLVEGGGDFGPLGRILLRLPVGERWQCLEGSGRWVVFDVVVWDPRLTMALGVVVVILVEIVVRHCEESASDMGR